MATDDHDIEGHRHPSVAADVVLFTGLSDELQVLLIERGQPPYIGKLAFPGGFVDYGESCEDAAARELHEETGLRGVMLTQLRTFSDPARDPRGHVVSVAFIGFVEDAKAGQIKAGDDAADAQWRVVSSIQPDELAFDHWKILTLALDQITSDAD